MSSSDEEKHFQSAQRPQDQIYAAEDQFDSSSVASSDVVDRDDDGTNEPEPQIPDVTTALDDPEIKVAVQDPEEAGTSSEEHSPAPNLPPTRPNKFSGPPSTWRNWTAPERDLAASLDQLTAKDLSIHLYNAFMLKKSRSIQARPRELELPSTAEHGLDDSVTWKPPKVWTAWPLPSEDVPREEESKRWEEVSILPKPSSVNTTRPSQLLRELLVAQILRIARGRFHARESEDQNSETSEVEPREGHSEVPSIMKPVVMTDDERASQVLQPTVQHIMTKIDDLLMGLHYARRSYLTIDDDASVSESQINERSTSRRKVGKRKRSASTRSTDTEMASDGASGASGTRDESTRSTMSKSRSRSKRPKSTSRKTSSQNLRSRMSRMGCRDWSDVLGVASMTGCPLSVVEKAAARCASLFGEGITFRTLAEGNLAFAERSYLPGVLRPLAVSKGEKAVMGKDTTGISAQEEEMVGGVHVDGFLQTITGKKSWKYSNKGARKRSASRGSGG